MNSDRTVTKNNDSIFLTKDDVGDVWMAVISDMTGRGVEIKLDGDALTELRDALTEVE